MDLYAENILDHYRHPRGKTLLAKPSVEHREINASCGDEITLQLLIEDGIIRECGWDGTGCAISQAAMSLLCEELKAMTVEDAAKLDATFINKLLGVPIGPRRVQCALLSIKALQGVLA